MNDPDFGDDYGHGERAIRTVAVLTALTVAAALIYLCA